jgi:hypothetical protein
MGCSLESSPSGGELAHHIRAILGPAKAVALAFTAIFRTFDRGDQTFWQNR